MTARDAGANRAGNGVPGPGRPRRGGGGRSTLRHLLHALDRRELELVEQQIGEYLAPESPALSRYRRTYDRSLPLRGRPVSRRQVIDAARRAEVVLVGDYHTLPESQRAALELALELARHRDLVLALEMVAARHQAALDAYAEGRFADLEFLDAIDYAHAWPFPWAHYRPLLDIARRRGWALVALDGPGPVARRDDHAARRIVRSLALRPDAVHLTLIGDLHLAPAHLPARLEASRPGTRMVVVHQNEPRIHEDLVGRGLDLETAAVLLGPGRYCLMNATPLRRERSYLSWIESRWGRSRAECADPVAELSGAVRRLADLLGVEAPTVDWEVRSGSSLAFLGELERRGIDRARLGHLRREIVGRDRCLVRELGLLYVRRPRSDDLAEIAMQVIQEDAGEPLPDEPPAGGPDAEIALLAAVRREALGYVGACMMHPLRVADAGGAAHAGRGARRRQRASLQPSRGGARSLPGCHGIGAAGELLAVLEARIVGRRPFRIGARLRDLTPAARWAVGCEVGQTLGRRLFLELAGDAIDRPALRRLLAPPARSDRRGRERVAILELASLVHRRARAQRPR